MSHVTPDIVAVIVNDNPGTLAVRVIGPVVADVGFSAHIHVGTPTMEIDPGSSGVIPGAIGRICKVATDR
ncbi:hypothetical protein ACRTEC_16660 [Janibacter indicus]|uniref:Uncharacterized protein n=1 Tax=Janibacter indicus TaxID=857417 RepID=A0A7L9IZZ0_9MICO|nr:hypothetical protein [Janibacter indicus]QOK22373.1 hypothetical protein IGS73_14990 [Janibacter indicus]